MERVIVTPAGTGGASDDPQSNHCSTGRSVFDGGQCWRSSPRQASHMSDTFPYRNSVRSGQVQDSSTFPWVSLSMKPVETCTSSTKATSGSRSSTQDGKYLSEFNGSETPAKTFVNPTYIAVDNSADSAKGHIYIAGENRGERLRFFWKISVSDSGGICRSDYD